MTQSPFLDRILRKNVIADTLRQYVRPTASLTILSFVAQAIKEGKEKIDSGQSKVDGQKDFLTRFIELQKHNPSIPPWAPTAWTFSNVIAGSDSVGTCMRTLLFHLLSYPNTFERLYKELKAAELSRPFPTYSEVRDLPYLEACVQEAIRIHPPFALPLERVVPEGGITVLGHYLPGGTVIGGIPYVVNRDTRTFGEDAEFWRPERWLEGDVALKRQLEASMLTVSDHIDPHAPIAILTTVQFGAGRRFCLGRHVGILEIKKLIPFLMLTYDVSVPFELIKRLQLRLKDSNY
jgi:cytochrome P450